MKRVFLILLTLVICPLIATSTVFGQRGMGDSVGVVRGQAEVEQMSGTAVVQEVVVEECTKTTGRYPIGIHLLVKDSDGKTLNLHLGPEPVLDDLADKIKPGMKVVYKIFRTDQMPEEFYIVEVLGFEGNEYVLRDKSLRPRWAGQRGKMRWLR